MNQRIPNARCQDTQSSLPIALGALLLSASTGCGGAPSELEDVEFATTERAAISDYDVCIKTKDKSNAGTSNTMTLSFYDSGDTWAASCTIDGIGRGETKCCTLSSSYSNSNWDCWEPTNDHFGIDHTGNNNAHVTRVQVYQNGNLHRQIDDFYCASNMNSCQSYLWNAPAQHGWFKTGQSQEKKVIVNLQMQYDGDPYGYTEGRSMSGCLN